MGDQEAARYLASLALPPCYHGYHYLCTALLLIENDRHLLQYTIKWLYPAIREHHTGSSPAKIERSVRTALRVIWENCPPDRLEQLFGFLPASQPTPKQFISYLFLDYSVRKRDSNSTSNMRASASSS